MRPSLLCFLAYYSAALNSFIHVVMYGYYFFSSLGVKQVVFIKRYITLMQMTQFITMMLQASYGLYTGGNGYPVLPTRILFFYMITLLALFLNFFIQDSVRTKEKKAALKTHTNGSSHGVTNGAPASPTNGSANGTGKKSKKEQ